jgi:hypothetical protein
MTTKQHSIKRWWRHLNMTRWQLRRAFPEATLQAITDSVHDSEQQHGGEIGVEAELSPRALLSGQTPRNVPEVFAPLRLDTHMRNAG